MPINRPTKSINEISFSVLDLASIVQGGTPRQSFQHSIDLAQLTEKLGFKRYWLAEHHNMPGIASSATSVVIGHVAAHTSTIRVGSGGIMLPNHSPLVIAEQFGTLEAMFPGRIDLGLGRAPGTDQRTAHALRGANYTNGDDFPEQLELLQGYFQGSEAVKAIPGEGANIPIWLLGSSGFSARLSAQLGMPFAFASHFSPENTIPALELYYDNFQPSEEYKEPYAMVAVNVIAADTDEEAEFLATSIKQSFLNMMRNTPSQLQPPVNNLDELMTPYEKAVLEKQLSSTIIGSPITVKTKLQSFLDETKADEIMVSTMVYDHNARLHSHKLVGGTWVGH
ncbi:LLM class flavin-dependent oxidoreductase [Evansella sp. AB-P1]|uniref:LLM class flavin-dependent oxidoreductase n=1 Tax=Evansella sp. AB-P1 TaxID=3037653 RepID=UPI00241BF432|nr:LLM class flavin-dependent oxidoreductase [Evansella sp. AB-P1]MDG5789816.1 LLM class flavin-dependent oxidoreductase [Evansella sp. AB-P1]